MTSLAAAMAYARRGLAVLPVRERGKEPLVGHGVHDASSDPAVIQAWWGRWPTANVAIAVPARFFVVDVDLRSGGDVELARLEHEHGALPPTVTARTGTGGQHRLFARPVGLQLRGKLAPGIDLLGVGRYFVAPPSVHPCGGRYSWTSPRGTPIAQPPRWLAELARQQPAPPAPMPTPRPPSGNRVTIIERAERYVRATPGAVSGSGGHLHTFLLAQRLVRGFGLAPAEALALMTAWNATCEPPWSRWELARKVREAARAGQMAPGCLIDARRSA